MLSTVQSQPAGEAEPVDYEIRPTFAVFYETNYSRVAAALGSTLNDRDLGMEAAAEAMARCYAHWDSVSGYDNPVGWVYRVGLNWALSLKRKLSRRLHLVSDPRVEDQLPADPQIAAALERLDLRLRSVVVCRILFDWSVTDTARALSLRPGTVKSRLHRALTHLAEELAHFDKGQP